MTAPVAGYTAPIACPRCAGPVVHVNLGKVIHDKHGSGTETRAIFRCLPCRVEYVVEVFLRPVRRPGRERGTRGQLLAELGAVL